MFSDDPMTRAEGRHGMMALDPGYSIEIDRIDKAEWHAVLPGFDDATFYQTWSYGERSWGESHLSHAVLSYHSRTVAAAQLRIVLFPFFRGGAAYLNWGPLWRVRDVAGDSGHLRNMLRALRNEYVISRRLSLRILPKILSLPENDHIGAIFNEEGYGFSSDSLRTFIIDLRRPLDEIRQKFPRTWKQSLNYAEKQGLTIWEARGDGDFEQVVTINKQMKARKSYIGSDSQEILQINNDLPSDIRLKVVLCGFQDEVLAALGWSNIGKIGFPLVGGTGDKALQYKASYLLWWEMIKRLKDDGFDFCDTAGVNQKRNPGGYHFKKSIAGKDAIEMSYVGRFDSYSSGFNYWLFNIGMFLREEVHNYAKLLKSRLRKKSIR